MYRNRRIFTTVSNDPQPAGNRWVCPAGVTRVRLVGFGGGGGGGGGYGGATVTNWWAGGGGGGGGAVQGEVEVDVTPGTTYEVVVGAGGTAGTGGSGASGNDGGDGGSTIFRVYLGSVVYTFRGAQGGAAGAIVFNDTSYAICLGGNPVIGPAGTKAGAANFRKRTLTSASELQLLAGETLFNVRAIPGMGGQGMTTHGDSTTAVGNTSPAGIRRGSNSIQGFQGGNGGAQGFDLGSGYHPADAGAGNYQEGGPGGGGGAGPAGNGGNGGDSTIFNTLGGNIAPNGGAAGGANTGAGGGGGSGGISGVNPNYSAGGAGGAGGSGKLIMYW